jgi:hypothetical protein
MSKEYRLLGLNIIDGQKYAMNSNNSENFKYPSFLRKTWYVNITQNCLITLAVPLQFYLADPAFIFWGKQVLGDAEHILLVLNKRLLTI